MRDDGVFYEGGRSGGGWDRVRICIRSESRADRFADGLSVAREKSNMIARFCALGSCQDEVFLYEVRRQGGGRVGIGSWVLDMWRHLTDFQAEALRRQANV